MLNLRQQWPGRQNHCGVRRYSRGLSIVELLVGVALGLFLLAGASSMLVSNIISSRALSAESRVNQNLRNAADLISRDLRRASYWENSVAGTTTSFVLSAQNPYTTISTGGSTITYSLARDASAGRTATTDLNTLNSADEQFGFSLNNGAIQMQVGAGNWRTITDTGTVRVTALAITPSVTDIDIRTACAKACCDVVNASCAATNVAASPGCPKITVRRFDLSLTGQSATDSAVVRTIRTSVRVRNDAPSGVCPS